jgi:hypothetical protein
MTIPLAVFTILRGKDRPYGRVQVDKVKEWSYLVTYFIGNRPAGFMPIQNGLGKNIAVRLAEKEVKTFARENKCCLVQRDGGKLKKVSKRKGR